MPEVRTSSEIISTEILNELKRLSGFRGEQPAVILHSRGDYKFRKNWFTAVSLNFSLVLQYHVLPPVKYGLLIEEMRSFIKWCTNDKFKDHNTTGIEVAKADGVLERVINALENL